jgi:thiol-disulfide isomerase/thioredoxin
MPESELLTRILLALALTGGGLGLYWLANQAIVQRARRTNPPLPNFHPGAPAILYFTTPECMPCKTVQRPAIQRLKERLGESLTVIEIDAQAQAGIARQWGVLSVPTTFIIDAQGNCRHVNHGVTRAEVLAEQVARVSASRPA